MTPSLTEEASAPRVHTACVIRVIRSVIRCKKWVILVICSLKEKEFNSLFLRVSRLHGSPTIYNGSRAGSHGSRSKHEG